MRTYIHDDHKNKDFFADIVTRLSGSGAHAEIIYGLLKDVCEHFHFGCGLIYEADHTETFNLKERYSAYNNQGVIHNHVRLEEHLGEEDLLRLKSDHIFIIHPALDENYQHQSLGSLFSANSLLMAPVILGWDKLAGFIAILDRRRAILTDSASVDAVKTVLKLLANHIKTRIIQRRLNYASNSLNSIMDHMGIDIYVNDFDTHEILYINQSMAAPYGGSESLMGRRCWEAFYEDKSGECDFCPRPKLIDEQGNPSKVYSWDYQRPFDGSWFRVLSAAFQWTDGRLAQVISSVDITDNKRNEETINRLAFFDQLTSLPNRSKLTADWSEKLPRLKDEGGGAWVFFFDLDNFKKVNDNMGHQAGDDLLAQVGRCLEDNPDTRGRCYRLGGDEFVLFYENVDRAFVYRVIDFLLDRFQKPWLLTHGEAVCQVSIGLASFPDDGSEVDGLLYQADQAMYRAKAVGKGRAVFSDGEHYQWAASSEGHGRKGDE